MPRHHFRSDPKFQEEYYVAFSEDDIHFKTSLAESRLEWAFYDKLWNMPRYYLLFYGRDMFSIIPKRAFTEKNQEEQFKELVQRKLSPAFIQIFS